MIRVITAAPDRSLLTIEELRSAAGVAGDTEDDRLTALGRSISALIAQECRVATDGIAPPTLRSETIEETIRHASGCAIILARRFVSEVSSVSENGSALALGSWEVDGAAGVLTRLHGDRCASWRGKVVVTYAAGFDEVPDDLKYAATLAVREFWSAADRDPLLRAETVEGVGRSEFHVGGSGRDIKSALPMAAVAALSRFGTLTIV